MDYCVSSMWYDAMDSISGPHFNEYWQSTYQTPQIKPTPLNLKWLDMFERHIINRNISKRGNLKRASIVQSLQQEKTTKCLHQVLKLIVNKKRKAFRYFQATRVILQYRIYHHNYNKILFHASLSLLRKNQPRQDQLQEQRWNETSVKPTNQFNNLPWYRRRHPTSNAAPPRGRTYPIQAKKVTITGSPKGPKTRDLQTQSSDTRSKCGPRHHQSTMTRGVQEHWA